ncbi:signal recognition particle-docking protein FtsY [Neisseria animalis]|uniref:Signal recognition particle receptor FtsY n=2 Tax=Neisseria animalis TaxID=492 RepID=A0A5P3MTP1_NEIAN|nr:signal recognition particle-docking protein FtsY [Neisseria animalis]ROW31669.1 signal recognition particle-docking protein FtsY [Neisseria animalis]
MPSEVSDGIADTETEAESADRAAENTVQADGETGVETAADSTGAVMMPSASAEAASAETLESVEAEKEVAEVRAGEETETVKAAEEAVAEQPSENRAESPAAEAVEPETADTASAPVQQPATNEAYGEETENNGIGAEQPPAETLPAAVMETAPEAEPEAVSKPGWAARLKQGLSKSRDKMAKSLAGVFGGGKIDEDLYEELETVLITSDMGMEATEYLMKDVRNRVSLKGLKDGAELRGALKEAVYDLIKPLEQPLVLPESKEPFVIMLAGINGAGKTTSIGKLAKYFQSQGKSVLLAAGDTFRAAAREQLQEWGGRNGVTVISQSTGDSAAVCFDAVQAAKARGIDVVLADTAGRLPTQLHLMEEIKKVKRVLQKAMPDAPHEIIVVLDANIGQNAVNQVKAFDDALGLTGLIVTKLDGTAKGGILAALAGNRPIPVRYIGVGEGIDDLRPFDARGFVDALLD